ncbi:MAG: hypothetical protein ABEL76_08980 [Bradymonadaceae bacterium]
MPDFSPASESIDSRRTGSIIGLVVALMLVCSSAVSTAHHVVSQYGIAPAEPVTRTSIQFEFREFDFDSGPSGTAETLTPGLTVAPVERVAVTARLPVAAVQYDGRSDVFGIGDLSAGSQVLLYASEHGGVIVSAGLGAEFPTGRDSAGLSSGHWELAPFVVASARPVDEVAFFTIVTDQFSVADTGGEGGGNESAGEGHHGHGHDHTDGGEKRSLHGSVLAPHADHEMRTELGVAYLFAPLYVATRVSAVFAWSRAEIFGPLETSAEFGWRPVEPFRLALTAEVPVVGPDRYDWKARVSAAWTF